VVTVVVTVVDTVVDMAAATLHTLAAMVLVATSGTDIAAAVAFSLVDTVAVSGTADGGVTALVPAGDGQTLTASTCGSAISS
jgi:hypothetical protein